jgi:hypothetical protein
VINGNTYSGTTIPSGSYVLWNGTLYKANGAIPSGSVSAANFTSLSATGGLNDLAKTLLVSVTSNVVDLGALSAGTSGIGQYTFTVPDGYKTTGITQLFKHHPAGGSGYSVIAAVAADRTGTITENFTYMAVTSVPNGSADFKVIVQCIRG